MGEGKREKGKLPGPKGKRESSPGPPGPKKEKPHDLAETKGKREKPGQRNLRSNSTRQPDRAYARTKRNDFPVEHPPTSDQTDQTDRRDFLAPAFSEVAKQTKYNMFTFSKLICSTKNDLGFSWKLLRCPGVSKDKTSWFWVSGTRPKIPKS